MAKEGAQVGKVLLVAPRMEPRGTCEYTLNLARQFMASGGGGGVFCAPGPMVEMLRRAEVPFRTFEHLEAFGLRLAERKRFLGAVA
ncbi:MAG: hypothetical protein ACYS8K_03095, partial [Planctomycetota bacterium]